MHSISANLLLSDCCLRAHISKQTSVATIKQSIFRERLSKSVADKIFKSESCSSEISFAKVVIGIDVNFENLTG
jgi:hypothetical protein